ncbi:helix-turn-helix transcriptional regulator [Nonomuraea wenchangensis]|uniref:helix-turn-helix transcriptional regulator n=1 Tax=Nonomuraea wenchangensis TaxID=568860 RepID=UPI00371BE9A9
MTTTTHRTVVHLSVEDLAARYGVPVHTIYEWNKMRTGPRYMRIGRHCRYKLADVEAWENSRYADGGV